MTKLLCVCFVVIVSAVVSACGVITGTGCAGVGYYALRMTVRDQTGRAAAIGSTVTVTDGSYRETANPVDSVQLFAASDRANHTYDVRVTKPYYLDAVATGVRTRAPDCVTGHERDPVTTTVPLVLRLAPNAPPVRSVHLAPDRILIDRIAGRQVASFAPVVDADASVSQAVTWSVSGDTASIEWNAATGIATYRCRATSGSVTVTARSVVDSTRSATAIVAVQGHPAAPNDPPC